jgi:anti-sigma B factor antagonist
LIDSVDETSGEEQLVEISVNRKKGVCVLACSGTLILNQGDTLLREEVETLLEAGEKRLVLQMSGLKYMDSAGVGETVASAKRAFEFGAVIKIVLPAEGTIRRIFAVTSLDRSFEIFNDEDEAIASLAD